MSGDAGIEPRTVAMIAWTAQAQASSNTLLEIIHNYCTVKMCEEIDLQSTIVKRSTSEQG